jgi:hypothetical protein
VDDRPYKLSVKFPDGTQFDAEGKEASVQADFQLFLEALRANPQTKSDAANPVKPDDPTPPNPNPAITPPTISPDLMSRVFLVQGENVSLRVLPTGGKRDPDALLLIIYGFRALKNAADVTGGRLAICARISGVQTDRVDRIIAQHDAYVTKGGVKKGKKYGLNNPGVRYAEELLTKLLG